MSRFFAYGDLLWLPSEAILIRTVFCGALAHSGRRKKTRRVRYDEAASVYQRSGIDGEILAWKEIAHGPPFRALRTDAVDTQDRIEHVPVEILVAGLVGIAVSLQGSGSRKATRSSSTATAGKLKGGWRIRVAARPSASTPSGAATNWQHVAVSHDRGSEAPGRWRRIVVQLGALNRLRGDEGEEIRRLDQSLDGHGILG